MATSIMQAAAAQQPADQGETFTPKDPREFVPPEQHDAVERTFAAGLKIMMSPEMKPERDQAIQSQEPVAKNIADNVLGLMLTLDQKSKGGLPMQTIFPAGVMLANEAANMLVHAGKSVTQDDYNESLQILYVQMGKKLGASDDQLMQGAQDALAKKNGGMDPADQTGATGDPTAPDPGAAPGGPGPMTAVTPPNSGPTAGVQVAPPQQGA